MRGLGLRPRGESVQIAPLADSEPAREGRHPKCCLQSRGPGPEKQPKSVSRLLPLPYYCRRCDSPRRACQPPKYAEQFRLQQRAWTLQCGEPHQSRRSLRQLTIEHLQGSRKRSAEYWGTAAARSLAGCRKATPVLSVTELASAVAASLFLPAPIALRSCQVSYNPLSLHGCELDATAVAPTRRRRCAHQCLPSSKPVKSLLS